MDFGALPPEVNSARMYAGAGSAPLLAAAAGWDGLAEDLYVAAAGYGSVVSGLTAVSWRGPASASMAAAAAPYVGWLNASAALAEQAGAQARAAAGAFEAAFAATVPPAVVAANRALSLVATNIFGQNTPAIAATEAQYVEMWAQDATAMYGYAGSSAVASVLTPFTEPAPATTQGGLVAQAASAWVGAQAQPGLSQLTSAMPGLLQQMAGPMVMALFSTMPSPSPSTFMSMLPSGLPTAEAVGAEVPALGSALGAGLGSVAPGPVGLSGAVSAGVGRAATIGALSVPSSWPAAAPTVTRAAVLPYTGLGAAQALQAGGSTPMLGGLSSLAPTADRGWAMSCGSGRARS